MRLAGLFLFVLLAACGETASLSDRPGAGPCWADTTECYGSQVRDGWTFSLSHADALGDGFMHLEVSAPADFAGKELLAVWEGESMYMGKMPMSLEQVAAGKWETSAALPDCAVDAGMVWRMSLMASDGPITLSQPLRVRAH